MAQERADAEADPEPKKRRVGAARPRLGPADKAITDGELGKMLEHLAARAVRETRRGIRRGPRARDRLIVELLALTGLRASELCALTVGDIELGGRQSYIRVRGGKARPAWNIDTMPLPWTLVPELDAWTKGRPADASLVQASGSDRALQRGEIWRVVKRAVRACELRSVLNVHSLRHYFITRIARESGSIRVVARLARLRSMRLVDTYCHTAIHDGNEIIGPMRAPGVRRRRQPR